VICKVSFAVVCFGLFLQADCFYLAVGLYMYRISVAAGCRWMGVFAATVFSNDAGLTTSKRGCGFGTAVEPKKRSIASGVDST